MGTVTEDRPAKPEGRLYATSANIHLNDFKDAATALKYFHKAMSCGYHRETCLEGIANCHLRLGEHGKALEYYQRLVDSGYFSITLGNNMAFLLARRGEFGRALELLDRALKASRNPEITRQICGCIELTRQAMRNARVREHPDKVFHNYVMRSLPRLRRLGKPTLQPFGSSNAAGCAVVVELRHHPWLEHCLRNVAHFLPDTWSMLVIHGTRNMDLVQQIIECWDMAHVIGLHNLNLENISQIEYSNLLKRPDFWDLIPTPRPLVFQTDCMLLRSGLEDFYEWDYIGAPWNDFHVPSGVGNGGLSLRTVSVMRAIAERYATSSPESELEDVFYARMLHLHGRDPDINGRLATRQAAHDFCAEWRLRDMPIAAAPLGLHQAWRSHPRAQVEAWFRQADLGYEGRQDVRP